MGEVTVSRWSGVRCPPLLSSSHILVPPLFSCSEAPSSSGRSQVSVLVKKMFFFSFKTTQLNQPYGASPVSAEDTYQLSFCPCLY